MKELAFIAAAALYIATYIGIPVLVFFALLKFIFS